jgi:hypothetical protein
MNRPSLIFSQIPHTHPHSFLLIHTYIAFENRGSFLYSINILCHGSQHRQFGTMQSASIIMS